MTAIARAAVAVAEDHETRREPAVERDRRLGNHGQQFDRRLAELRHRVGGHADERRITAMHGCRRAIAHEQGWQLLRELGQLDRSGRCCAHRNDVELAVDLRIGGQREDRRHVVQIAERKTGWSCAVETQRTGAARGDEKVRSARRTQQPERGKSLLGQPVHRHQHRSAIMRRHDDRPSRPELGKAPLHSDLFGRAKQGGTPTHAHVTPHTWAAKSQPLGPNKNAPERLLFH